MVFKMNDQVIDVNDQDIDKLLSNPDEYRKWIIDILELDTSALAIAIREKLENNEIDGEIDLLLRQLGEIPPYNFLIPSLRDQLGLTINTDKDCIESLRSFKRHLKDKDDKIIIDKLIRFISDPNGELDESIFPELDLMSMIEDMPISHFPSIFNCIDYINSVSEDIPDLFQKV